MKKRIAVVILNYNGKEMLDRFLPLVIDCSPQAHVYVADNASCDDSVSFVKEKFPQVTLVMLEKNYGFAEGYNRALKSVDAEYYMLLNSDVEVTAGWLAPLLSYMDDNKDVAVCQPKLLDYKKRTHFEYAGAAGGFIDRYGYPYCRGRIFNVVEEDKGQYDSIADVFWASGAAFMIRSTDFWNVGGFDGRFFAHMEEIDLCWRLRSQCRRVVCVPESVVYHVGGATLSKSNPHKTYLNFRNNHLMLYKNLPINELVKVILVRLFLDYIAAFKFWLSGNAGDAKAVMKAGREYRKMRQDFAESRKKCLDSTLDVHIPEKRSFSILWMFHVRRKRRFSDLP